MLRRVVIGGCLALALVVGTLVFRDARDDGRAYIAESLLIVRPFNQALLRHAFEREVVRSCPGVTRVGFEVSTVKSNAPNGTTTQTNGFIRLLAAAATAAEAERLAENASDGVRATLRQHYGAIATPIGQAHGAPSSALHEPFRFRFGDATPGYFPTAGRVFFPKPAISIDPGGGWMRDYKELHEPECHLVLIGKGKFNGAFIDPYQFGPELTNIQSAVGELRSQASLQQGNIDSSWKAEPFATQTGLHGVHISFTQRYSTTHYYLSTNAQSRCVGIRCVSALSSNARPVDTISAVGSEEVQRMSQRTLRID
jgi:hypothetical protein